MNIVILNTQIQKNMKIEQYTEKMIRKYKKPEYSGKDTPYHAEMTSKLMKAMVETVNQLYPNTFSKNDAQALIIAAGLHDIGKVSIPKYILDKNGKLTDEEYNVIKSHTIHGRMILNTWLRNPNLTPFQRKTFMYAEDIAYNHHERINGTGYPRGISGDKISLPSKMMAIVDVIEALTAKRTYKKESSFEDAKEFMLKNAGILFDKELTIEFLNQDTWIDIIQNQKPQKYAVHAY